ncbi:MULTISPECIES: hypothetical protein [unclassified Shewanella]|uniref:hypothetical protein n=1 Tax=unclassified Shewanella TaxID=196818 RepID=UPI000C863A3E|nr:MULTISPECIES: hypothetical protein [unclassified Shewanella]MDO6619896.1 hypothetical protein [Shewanella sp. 6_MG-2023]MDO6641067.1 hypothetical protein [Shewanella sp. 5_MG-2023]MDO6679106.1 hypothetical protein [Shewanella sp. 4_MG-2023]PMG27048.1 hypothetical protein BCU94_05650 [Shewanella sp. 10N.286.52.C2]PMG41896.1 hypothetical protein BCU91_09570 [Shewanella sp. 10N.286.52.B9]
MSNLTEFFTQLSSDAKLLEAYKKDPRGVMQANGLSDKDIDAVMSGDMAQVKSLVGDVELKSILLVHHLS